MKDGSLMISAIMIYPDMMNAIAEGSVSIFGLSILNFSYISTIVPIVHPALMVYNMSIAGASFAYGLKWEMM